MRRRVLISLVALDREITMTVEDACVKTVYLDSHIIVFQSNIEVLR